MADGLNRKVTVDGPGTPMTLFVSWCPLRCQYCHNPDTMELRESTLEHVEDVIERVKHYRRVFDVTGGGHRRHRRPLGRFG